MKDPGFESRKWQHIFFSSKGPRRLWDPPSLLFGGHLGFLAGVTAAGA